jgi:uncharacterized membrane protein YeaQ/YmgE (transglycosylase-associated protein family)
MGIISWIIIGALAGWIASMIMDTNEEQGAFGNIIVGVLGAIIGGWVLDLFMSGNHVSGFNIGTLLTAILGSVILLAIVKAFRGPRHHAVR